MSISADVRACTLCPLSAKLDDGFKPLPGNGSPTAKIMFVYDTLTGEDYLIQQCFTGQAGLLFDKLLAKCELSRKEVYITPLVKCYASCKADITKSVVTTCGGWLDKQIAALKPNVIVPCGKSSIEKVLNKKNILMRDATKTIVTKNSTLIISFPALHSLLNAGNSTFNYHVDRLLEGKKWVSQQAFSMVAAEKS